MPILPTVIMCLLLPFSPIFSPRVWRHVPLLVAGAILAPGHRMVSSVLRVVGVSEVPTYQTYHRVLNRAVWSSLQVSRVLLGLLITAFAPDGVIVVGFDETIERRRGAKIAACGIYRDPVRSSKTHVVKTRGLRSRLPDALGAHSLDHPDLGAALSDGAGALRTVPHRARPPA